MPDPEKNLSIEKGHDEVRYGVERRNEKEKG